MDQGPAARLEAAGVHGCRAFPAVERRVPSCCYEAGRYSSYRADEEPAEERGSAVQLVDGWHAAEGPLVHDPYLFVRNRPGNDEEVAPSGRSGGVVQINKGDSHVNAGDELADPGWAEGGDSDMNYRSEGRERCHGRPEP